MKRMKKIEEKFLMPFIKEFSKESSKSLRRKNIVGESLPGENLPGSLSGECPDGFINCGGCCVPYQCP
jgi:hypothetical protein